MREKSVRATYACWLFGGLFGLHHFYLERDLHAFLLWSTLGGYCGVGWLFDVLYIPRYVREANQGTRFLEEYISLLKKNRKPPFSTTRFLSGIIVSYLWAQLIKSAIPENEVAGIDVRFLHWLVPLGAALGTWAVGNVGMEQGSIKLPLATAYICYLVRFFIYSETIWFNLMVVACQLVFDSYSKERRTKWKPKKSFVRRIRTLSLCGGLYIGLICSFLYFNGTVTDSYGDEIPVSEAIHHFFNSPWWTDLKQSLFDLWNYAQHHGWYEIWKEIIDMSDLQGEQNAYKVLDLTPSATQSEITSRWRLLSREHHPDKVKDPALQRSAQEKFMEIQQAYEILSNIKSKRSRKNKRSQ